MDNLRPHPEDSGADYQSEVESAPAGGIDNPVEDEGEDEEGEEMEDFLVGLVWRKLVIVREEPEPSGNKEEDEESN